MEQFTAVFNTLAGLFTVAAEIAAVALFITLVFFREKGAPFLAFVGRHALWIVLFVSGASFAGSLTYSEFIGYAPCALCWWERIFIYPQLVIAIVALAKKRDDVMASLLSLSVLGGLVATYHSYIQYGGEAFIPCAKTGVSCAQRYVFEFGYITIPLMALSAFLMIIAVLCARKVGMEYMEYNQGKES